MNSDSSFIIDKGLDPDKIPLHVAIIMDGNGRWAKKRLLNRIKGHESGVETVRSIVRTSRKIGINTLTLYAFSTENWERPKLEVSALMSILKKFLVTERQEMMDNNIRLNAIGELHNLPENVLETFYETKEMTKNNKGMLLNLALSYGSRSELIFMVKNIAQKVNDGVIDIEDITPECVSSHLYTANIPDPDILIRTSGEVRISNFLLWQIAYSELFFTKTLWPDFSEQEFVDILKAYQLRERRFGKVLSK